VDAVNEARKRVAAGFIKPEPREGAVLCTVNHNLGDTSYTDIGPEQGFPTRKARQARGHRSPPKPEQTRQFAQPSRVRAANRSIAVNAVAQIEATQTKTDRPDAAYMARQHTEGDAYGQSLMQTSISRPTHVWAPQEANQLRVNTEDTKTYMGIKYEHKQTGPFAGKLVAPGTIISIEDVEYVEYRVLAKVVFVV
jgi:hypothetical protein